MNVISFAHVAGLPHLHAYETWLVIAALVLLVGVLGKAFQK
jgi:hypothetical protein